MSGGVTMSDLISRKAVEKIIKEFFKTKVDEISLNKLCDLCDLYLELNADLHKEIEDIPVAYNAVSDDDNHVIDTEKAIEIVKGAVKDE
jgi:hypothetical protein